MFLRGIRSLAWLLYAAGCLLIVWNSIADYLPGGAGLFIADKGAIGENPWWRASLHVHIVSGIVCLFAALPQFSRRLIRRLPALHRLSGRLFGLMVLLFVAPTGIHLALHAKGGAPGKLGFLTLACGTLLATVHGWRAALPAHRDLAAHRAWMTRAFALVASAVTFRIFHTVGHLAGLGPDANYVLCLWLSLLGNAAVAEIVIRHRPAVPSPSIQLQPES